MEGGNKLSEANERQVGGTHYQANTVQCPHCGGVLQHWDIYKFFPYLVGTITKYLWRWRDKNGLEDLEKGGHYYQKQLEVAKAELAAKPESSIKDEYSAKGDWGKDRV